MKMFQVKKNGQYLQGFDINENYVPLGRAIQTDLHNSSEFKSVWGESPHSLDYRTASGYMKTLFENIFWESEQADIIEIVIVGK